jgi:hypothetical protein
MFRMRWSDHPVNAEDELEFGGDTITIKRAGAMRAILSARHVLGIWIPVPEKE